MNNYLTEDFLLEFFKLLFLKKSVLEVAQENFKYQYIPKELEALKKILKCILVYHKNEDKLPTYGYVSQMYQMDMDVQVYLSKIKDVNIPDLDSTLEQLECYIKDSEFQLLYEKIDELYRNDKAQEAIKLNAQEAERIVNFSITKGTTYFKKVFAGFEDRIKEKEDKKHSGEFDREKVPFSIREIDDETYGGIDRQDTVCFLARSGVGKSTVLKWIGYKAALLGYDVMHVQAEGSEQECMDKYDQIWTASDFISVKYGKLDSVFVEKMKQQAQKAVAMGKDVYVHSFEMFDEATCKDIRDQIIKYSKEKGKAPDLILVDSLDLLSPGDGIKYGIDTQATKMKKENSARKLKNLAIEFDTRIVTADKADNVSKEDWNNPDWCMTHSNSSGSKNIDSPFSYYITINQTVDEKENEIIRLYLEKLRNYHPQNRVIKIATNYGIGRFYNAQRTKQIRDQVNVQVDKSKTKSKRVKSGGK